MNYVLRLIRLMPFCVKRMVEIRKNKRLLNVSRRRIRFAWSIFATGMDRSGLF